VSGVDVSQTGQWVTWQANVSRRLTAFLRCVNRIPAEILDLSVCPQRNSCRFLAVNGGRTRGMKGQPVIDSTFVNQFLWGLGCGRWRCPGPRPDGRGTYGDKRGKGANPHPHAWHPSRQPAEPATSRPVGRVRAPTHPPALGALTPDGAKAECRDRFSETVRCPFSTPRRCPHSSPDLPQPSPIAISNRQVVDAPRRIPDI
jgi:hypothetical protein